MNSFWDEADGDLGESRSFTSYYEVTDHNVPSV